MAVDAEGDYVLNFQERVQQLERQLKEMEREKERELNALRKEKRELVHTNQTVGGIYDIMDYHYYYYYCYLTTNSNILFWWFIH